MGASSLKTLVIWTSLGATYVLPDVTDDHFERVVEQIDIAKQMICADDTMIVVTNVSEACLSIPYRILNRVWLASAVDVSAGEEWKVVQVG